MSKSYPVSVFWSEEDGGFIALAPDLPGCSAFGETQQDALRELDQAIAAWIDAAQKAGNPIPRPSDPSAELGVSGKYPLRMPKSLHWTLIQGAKREGVSLNQHLVFLLTRVTSEIEVQLAATAAPTVEVVALAEAAAIPVGTSAPGVFKSFIAAPTAVSSSGKASVAKNSVVVVGPFASSPSQIVFDAVAAPSVQGALH
jgi:predicted RNase H-like HicB family nuclease